MDLHLRANRQLHYGVNGDAGRNPRPGDDDALQFLSLEEQECLQFFEDTIESLQASLDDSDLRQADAAANRSAAAEEVDGPLTSSPNPAVTASPLALSSKDQDIIDLVRPELDMVPTREPSFNPMNPDFQSMMRIPGSHFEMNPKHDAMVSSSSEHGSLSPSGSYVPTESHASYHPPGCIPTPVLIAHKIAKNQAGGASSLLPASLVHRGGLESSKPPGYGADGPVRQGPPAPAKSSRFPANINVILGSKDHNQPQSSVSIEERRVQMLTNLTESHPPPQAQEQKVSNVPRRSISFKDPLPDKSRMEALSKLGLTRNRAMSGGVSLLDTPKSSSLDRLSGAEPGAKPPGAKPPGAGGAPASETSAASRDADVTTASLSHMNAERRTEILRTHSLRSNEARSPPWSPSPPAAIPVIQSGAFPPPPVNKAPAAPPPEVSSPPEVTLSNDLPPAPPPEVTSPAGHAQPSPSPPEVTLSSDLPPPLDNKASTSCPPEVSPPQAIDPQSSPSPPAVIQSSVLPPPLDNKAAALPPPEVTPPARLPQPSPPPPEVTQGNALPSSPPPEVTSLEFNSYGGKSIVVNPSFPSKGEPGSSPMTHDPKILSPALAHPSQFNRFGGKSKVVTPAPVAVNRSDLPDILSSHISRSQTLPSKPELQPIELNSYGGRTRTINPSGAPARGFKSFRAPAPAPAPKPARHSFHGPAAPQMAAQHAASPERSRRSGSLFRPQSITVKFSGRGGSEESRRDALRKLGLLKES